MIGRIGLRRAARGQGLLALAFCLTLALIALPIGHAAAAGTCDVTTGFPNLRGRDLSGCDLSLAFLPRRISPVQT